MVFLLELGSTQPSSWASLSSSETSATPTTVTIFTTSTILVNETGCHVKLVGSVTKTDSWQLSMAGQSPDQSPDQSPESRVQSPESRVQSPESRVK